MRITGKKFPTTFSPAHIVVVLIAYNIVQVNSKVFSPLTLHEQQLMTVCCKQYMQLHITHIVLQVT